MAGSETSKKTLVVGVTGGIGSGKSFVANRFNEAFGIPVIDADLVAREVVEPGTPGLIAVTKEFGSGILTDQGELDRRALKKIVFDAPKKRRALETILHPLIRERMIELIGRVEAAYCLICIPLLAEGGGNPLVDRVLVVDCAEGTQIERVMKRDNLTESEVMAIMGAQARREERLQIADDVIVNDGDLDTVTANVLRLHEKYSNLAN